MANFFALWTSSICDGVSFGGVNGLISLLAPGPSRTGPHCSVWGKKASLESAEPIWNNIYIIVKSEIIENRQKLTLMKGHQWL